jgi:DNA-binding transcriptional ArsR family regulator
MAENEQVNRPETGESRVLDAGALKALAHPMRVRIYDILSQFGPQTASSLAERLGESSGATSYHLRALAKHDLIREVEERGSARERWWERPRGSIRISAPDALRTPSGRAASQIVVTETYRQRHEQLMDFIAQSMRDEEGDETPAELSTATTRLTKAQFDHFSGRLSDIITESVELYRDQVGDGVRPYLIRLDMFPIDDPQAKDGR